MKNLKAVSPVIATIIIVAIAIVMAIAVAYWMLGLGGAFTRYEKLEIPTAYAVKEEAGSFKIYLTVKNTGSAAATIDVTNTLYNGKPRSYYEDAGATITWDKEDITLEPGEEESVVITLDGGNIWRSGMTIELTIHTVAGKDYPKVVVLP